MKNRERPFELKVYDALLHRKPFSEKEKSKHRKLKRGYEGELLFDNYLEKIPSDYILLKDYWLSHNNRFFQIDHALLINNRFYLYDVKNFIGDYYYEEEALYYASGAEVDDPLIQLKRTESLVRQLLQSHRFQPCIQAAIVFINPEFALFQAPRDAKMLLPNQLNRHLKQFMNPHPMDPALVKIANKLKELRLEGSPFLQLPHYCMKELKKGIRCKLCKRVHTQIGENIYECKYCGAREWVKNAVMRNIQDFKILFPERKITTQAIYEWCNIGWSKRRIQYLLKNNFIQKGSHRGVYYV